MAKRKMTSTCNEEDKSNYYIYAYKAKDTGEIVYIGKATGNRVNELNKHFTHNMLLKKIYENRGLCPVILDKDLTLAQVTLLEKEYIRDLHPVCNKVHNG